MKSIARLSDSVLTHDKTDTGRQFNFNEHNPDFFFNATIMIIYYVLRLNCLITLIVELLISYPTYA